MRSVSFPISTLFSIKIQRFPERCPVRHPGYLFIDIDKIEASALPDESYVTTISLAELAAGPHAADDPN
jgi:hypothetical protein